jgi:hypothetical protein
MPRMSSRLFSHRQRSGCRDIARESLIAANWDGEKAKQIAESRANQKYGSVWVTIALAIIFKLIELWLKRRKQDPTFQIPDDWQDDEPGQDSNENVMHVDEPHADLGEFD